MRITKTDLLMKLSHANLRREETLEDYETLLVDFNTQSKNVEELESRIRRLEKVIQLLSNHIVKDNV